MGQMLFQLQIKNYEYETSHEEAFLTHEDDYFGEFHMAIKKQIIAYENQ